ncbi:MAG: ATP-binding cassette domain-containing protein [Defluviitaleaceae bacterium]|nr:ATP-binding cassette domain-containing protein [Defluviitaleaceae bacterium]
MIEINALSKRYDKGKGKLALDNINLTISDGMFVALLGHNGSGKSTLIKCVTGVMKALSGHCSIDGEDSFKHRKKLIKKMGIMFSQKTSFIIDLSVSDNLFFFKTIYGIDDKNYKNMLDYLDGYLNFKVLLDKPYRKLSLGERTKCEIVSVLLHAPQYIVLDEPTIGLDYEAKAGLYTLLGDMKIKGVTCLIITHEVDYIENFCDKAIILHHGKIALEYSAKEIGSVFRDKGRTALKIKHSGIIDEASAQHMLSLADSINSAENTFRLPSVEHAEKEHIVQKLFKSFSIISIETSEISIREMLEDVLKKGD